MTRSFRRHRAGTAGRAGRRARLTREHGVGRRQRQRAQQTRGCDGLDGDVVAVRLEHVHQCVTVGHGAAGHLVKACADARHDLPHVDHALLHDHDGRGETRFEVESGRYVVQRRFERLGIERGFDDRDDDLVLVGERPEDGAFGDAGGLRDLAARDPITVLEEQWQRRRDDHRPPLVGGKGRRPLGLGLSSWADHGDPQ